MPINDEYIFKICNFIEDFKSKNLIRKIWKKFKKNKEKKAKIGVIGLGYVGLPLCEALLSKVLKFWL